MESAPYCLDFDVIQAFRTACEQTTGPSEVERERVDDLRRDVAAFFVNPPKDFTLHKIPGALATYHECDLLLGTEVSELSGGTPVDIIKEANWL